MDSSAIIVPAHITRSFIRSRLDLNFVYSTNVFEMSHLGQAAECRGEPNAFGVPVRFRFCKSDMSSYFSDNDYVRSVITRFLQRIPTDKPVIVLRKIGCGASRMREYAPKTWEWMQGELNKIAYPNIKWDYTV